MVTPQFVHLRLHSEYSILDGTLRIEDAVARAVQEGMPALALTDLANMFGLVKFYKAAREKGVKPIAGCDVWIGNDQDRDRPSRALLLCQDRFGYHRMCELLTRAYRTNQHRGRAELRKAWFEELGTEGLIALSGAMQGDIGQALLMDNAAQADQLARDWARLFPERFYVELQRAGQEREQEYVTAACMLAARVRLPVVATHPLQFLDAAGFRAHEARVCISRGYMLSDRRRPREHTQEQYFKSEAQMVQLFADLPSALANSVEIARRCSLDIELGRSRLPLFPTPEGIGLDEYLRRQSYAGLEQRLAVLHPEAAQREQARPRYVERLEMEIGTIVKMGFPGYFLIVADFINWAKNNGVPVGPGRGSGAGSLVAYCLAITDLDPLRYELLFERFLNPERVSMPDFDIDFCQDGRDRVIEYVRRKYGADSVSQIATFGTMAAKAVVRDVGRVLDLPYNFCDQLAKLIPFQPGKLITLKMAREMEPLLAQREEKEEEVRTLLALGESLEGMTRNVGMHAGGVLIAPGKLTDFCPLYCAEGTDSVVSQFDKDDVEAVGLVKFDFLGLTTLTILDWTVKFIRRLEEAGKGNGHVPVLESLPLDDAQAFRIFSSGNTSAVFQFESRGMRDLLKRARPDRFEDIIALVALYRPGPMDLIPDFIDRKHGRQKVEYLDPRLEPLLGETYGIMVYQEQVMQIAQVIGGYTLGGADLLRRAMGKKKPEEMATHRDIFLEGAQKNGLGRSTANQLFDLMEKFAGYGFNKSHAAAYALVAYQTAYMKAHHAAAFVAANFSAVMDDTDKVHALFEDARENGLIILPPDINASEYRFMPVDRDSIRYGLGGIKGTGESAIEAILAARGDGGPFRDLFDFCRRMDKRVVNRRVLEALIRAGAFDCIDDHRQRLFASAGIAIESAEQASRAAGQNSLFGDADGDMPQRLIERPRWSERQRLQEEKQALGFYLSGHPFTAYREELQRFVRTSLARLGPASDGEGGQRPQLIAGIVDSLRWANTQNGRMLIVKLSDGTGSQEVSVYNEVADQVRGVVREDALLIIEARVRMIRRSGDEGEESFMRVSAERVHDLAGARAKFARMLELRCNGGSSGSRLRELLAPYRSGGCPVSIHYSNGAAECRIDLGDGWRVKPEDDLLEALHEWLEPQNVELVY
ncbi:MAG: DNA polymerase III subunit alpha [Burkholderiales bacterium]|nr:DNA polymerase III subunit alpha [Burkholderiales bacterium]